MANRNRNDVRLMTVPLPVLTSLAVWLLLAGPMRHDVSTPRIGGTGEPQLVSVTPMPNEMCEMVPASTSTLLQAALQQERALSGVAARPAAGGAEPNFVSINRAPLRMIRDPRPTFSAVAVDNVRDEIVLQDENTFQILVYDRKGNTPPNAAFTEPKRVIGGVETKVEFNCAIYVDPQSGDIYAVNNDTIDTMTVFSRNARGNVHPDRELRTPHRTYGISVDEGTQELYLTVQHPPQVVVYRKQASGSEKPLRSLVGNQTHLEDPHGIAVDPKHGLMFVANYGNVAYYKQNQASTGGRPTVEPGSGKYFPPSITVYPLKATGDVAPVQIISGPKTQLNWPSHIFVDPEHQELFVANDTDHSVLVFRTTDNGDVAPIRMLRGDKSGLKNPVGVFLDTKNDELAVASMGNHSANFYPRTASGDVAPLRSIRSAPAGIPALQIGNPGAVAYDSKRDQILVPN
jgi:6-phosphogluconolactonase (cycloisomerase 2 family)